MLSSKFLTVILLLLGVLYVQAAIEQWAGEPKDCKDYLEGKLIYFDNGQFPNQAILANVTHAGIKSLKATGPSCQKISISSLCKYAFPTVTSLGPPPMILPACSVNCLLTQQYCVQTFVLFNGGNVPAPFNNCSQPGWGALPNCVPPIDTSSLVPSWYSETFSIQNAFGNNLTLQAIYRKVYEYCAPYAGSSIFLTDQASQGAIATVVLPKLLAVEAGRNTSLPFLCADATIELICKTAYNPPVVIKRASLVNTTELVFPPLDFVLPSPPCENVCTVQNDQCAETFWIAKQLDSLVNCSGPSPFGLPQYPKNGWGLPFPPKGYFVPCTQVSDIDPNPVFRCEKYDKDISGKTCAKYFDGKDPLIFIPPNSVALAASLGGKPSQKLLASIAKPLLEAVEALPDYCRVTQEELICKSVFQECSVTKYNISTRNPSIKFSFTYGSLPCRDICQRSNEQCAQILSITGNSKKISDCKAESSTGGDSYPKRGVSFSEIFVPCAETTIGKLPKPFSCEKFKGKPSECKKYVDYDVMVTPDFTQDYLAKQVSKAIDGTDQLPDSCRQTLVEFACHTGFRKCQEEEAEGVDFSFGRRPCRSHCDRVVKQCGALFVIAGKGSSIPDCGEVDATDQQKTYPKKELEYKAFGEKFDVPCVEGEVNPSGKLPVRCEKLSNDADFCKPYVSEDSVLASDPIPQDTAVAVVSQFNELMKEAPDSCKDYALNLACGVMFQSCETKDADGFELVIPHPPCRSACEDIPDSCKDYFKFYGIPIPDCDEEDQLTSQPRYPKNDWDFEMGKHDISADCRKQRSKK